MKQMKLNCAYKFIHKTNTEKQKRKNLQSVNCSVIPIDIAWTKVMKVRESPGKNGMNDTTDRDYRNFMEEAGKTYFTAVAWFLK